ncbi:glucosamine-6-phosphate deaminase [Mycetocola tolaasinivorans]|uniref:Glucosamine-6-phosphate deaminase n=1 Tax=Mycetocola tolaasinivorans TaxID=76635 RepID=A0A3L7A5W4_9MICO|nr:glucosamine-6-phosphate deaminase [Mycetocola tolaasinivorans]RLP75494.1 glucosamine-6-phosphate deaminase [Mycetocola tolaasinivorans]
MTEVLVVAGPAAAGEYVADILARAIQTDPETVLGLATGSTPLPIYAALAERVRTEGIDVSSVSGFALDEYVGIDPAHEQSYHHVIDAEVTQTLGLNPERVHVPSGNPDTLESAGAAYEEAIRAAGGVGWQILGIGANGHIGFNEPGSPIDSLTRQVPLTEQTRQDNARFFDSIDDVPRHAITQGVGTILRAGHLFLLAFGEHKADAVARAINGPVSPEIPASAIQQHPNVTVLLDAAAASGLDAAEYTVVTGTPAGV